MFSEQLNLLPKDGEVLFFSNFFRMHECDIFFESLLRQVDWRHEPIFIFGEWKMQPRLTAWFGENDKTYTYSGITMTPKVWLPQLLEIKTRIESVSETKFSSALLNQYRDENDSMGWHSDNEKELGEQPSIASVSLGASRKFQLRHKTDKHLRTSIELSHGSFLLMRGETQKYWEHCIPKQSAPCDARINITFRNIKS